MLVITTRNAESALHDALLVISTGYRRDTRNGPVLQNDGPICTTYLSPMERVIFAPWRDANPFFHLLESVWMLAGRNDVATLLPTNSGMIKFSDDDESLHGAYGFRWRQLWGFDQIQSIVEALKRDKTCRRQVLQMWHPSFDLGKPLKDVPCNLTITFQVDVRGALEMTVFCRSNDIIWGAYGANVVHMSYLQEYVARMIGVPLGKYHQISVNWHAYEAILEKHQPTGEYVQRYDDGAIRAFPLISDITSWHVDLNTWWRRGTTGVYQDPFFAEVLVPMMKAHAAWKTMEGLDRFDAALAEIAQCVAWDWRMAGAEWLHRRRNKYLREQDDGPNDNTMPENR